MTIPILSLELCSNILHYKYMKIVSFLRTNRFAHLMRAHHEYAHQILRTHIKGMTKRTKRQIWRIKYSTINSIIICSVSVGLIKNILFTPICSSLTKEHLCTRMYEIIPFSFSHMNNKI